jgi:hypothetical protein
MGTPYAQSRTRLVWVAATIVGACYGVFLIGQFTPQPAVKALTAVLLAVAWLMSAGFFFGHASVPSATPSA